MMQITKEHFTSLASKIDDLDLSPEEEAALGYLLTAGRADGEVEGYGVVFEIEVKAIGIQLPGVKAEGVAMAPIVRHQPRGSYLEVSWE